MEEEIKNLNYIWGQRNLELGFFHEHIWPLMKANCELDKYLYLDRFEWDWLIVTAANPYYMILLNHLIKPKNVLVLLDESEKRSIIDLFNQLLGKKVFWEYFSPPAYQIERINFSFKNFETLSLSGSVEEFKHVEGGVGETYYYDHYMRKINIVVDISQVHYIAVETIKHGLEKIQKRENSSPQKQVIEETFLSAQLVSIASLVKVNTDMSRTYTGPTSGWQKNSPIWSLFPYALGWEIISSAGKFGNI